MTAMDPSCHEPLEVPMHAGDLQIRNLTVKFGHTAVVRDVSLSIPAGTSFGLVGESGSGKSMTCRAIMGIVPAGGHASGHIVLGGRNLLTLSQRELRRVRGTEVAMVFQDPMSSLNPLLRVGRAIAQVIRAHREVSMALAHARAVEFMDRVGIHDAERRANRYPHEFSGGMRQRVVIAMALACRPRLLLADEPTTALDVIVQAGVLRLIADLRGQERMGLLLVSHDLAVVAGLCDRIGVMYAGELVEEGPTSEVLANPRHPYLRALIASMPENAHGGPVRAIAGSPPDVSALPSGCVFAPRCVHATVECLERVIPLGMSSTGHLVRCIHEPELKPFGDGGGDE